MAKKTKPDAAMRAAEKIWEDLSERSGFGLECLRDDDAKMYAEIQKTHAAIIRQECAAKAKEK